MSGRPMHFGLRSPVGLTVEMCLGPSSRGKRKAKRRRYMTANQTATRTNCSNADGIKPNQNRHSKVPKENCRKKHRKAEEKERKKPQTCQAISRTHSEADRESKQPYRHARVKQNSRTKCARAPQKFLCLCVSLLFEVCWRRRNRLIAWTIFILGLIV